MKARRGGLTLIECLVAIFIITFAILIMAALFRSALEGARRANKIAVGTTVASKVMAEVIYRAQEPGGFASWTAVDGLQRQDTQFPDFVYRIDSEFQTQYSPCSQSELRYPVGQQRLLSKSLREVRVRVSWSPYGARDVVNLVSLVGAPPVVLQKVGINESIPSPMAGSGSTSLTVYAKDPIGTVIPDLFYDWSLSPETGNGELVIARDGRSATLTNRIYDQDLGYITAPGTAQLQLRSSLAGVQQSDNTGVDFGP
ncbi:prepilin-type N-terminal cleavage/methylation domain-containing protein [bacterium]|nr:prepilin-type N-terminal cleavage/methylation domain-containing protein [bacterium]